WLAHGDRDHGRIAPRGWAGKTGARDLARGRPAWLPHAPFPQWQDQRDRGPGRLPAPAPPELGLGGPALRDAIERKLGDRRPRRSPPARSLVDATGGPTPPRQSAFGADPGRAIRAEPLLSIEPTVPQPALPEHGRRVGCARSAARSGAADARGPGPQRRPPHRPRRGVEAQIPGPRPSVGALRR